MRGSLRWMGLVLALVGAAPASPAWADEPAADPAGSGGGDPLEGMNRGIFWFNERVDRYFLEPVAIFWDCLLPEVARKGVRNVFDNAREPIVFVNDLLQAKPVAAAEDLGRFLVNTTAGVAGVWDPAKRIGLPGNDEDFGQTLGYWGVPAGPYLVLPLLGPSNPRDTVGLVADSAARVYPYFVVWWVSSAITATDVVNRRSLRIEEIRAEREAAFDFYVAVRNAYVSLRENKVNDREPADDEEEEDLYYLDEDPVGEPDRGN